MKTRRDLVLAMFALSGLLAIQYEVIWLRFFTHVVGSGVRSVSAVVTAFLLGLALGAAVIGRSADRAKSPLFTYGLLEIAIGLAHLVSLGLFSISDPLYRGLFEWLPYSAVKWLAFALAFAYVTLPATLIGGTLPALSRYLVQREDQVGSTPGVLYSINMLGSVVGALLLVGVLLPELGYVRSLWAVSVASMLLGGVAVAIARRDARSSAPTDAGAAPSAEPAGASGAAPPEPPRQEPVAPRARELEPPSPGLVLAAYALSGFAALGLEVVWARQLAFIFKGSLQTFGVVLALYLGGLALGTLLSIPLLARSRSPARLFGLLEGAAGLLGLCSLWLTWTRGIGALTCLSVFVVTIPLGATFPVAVRLSHRQLSVFGRSLGDVYAANTLGSIVGSFSTGFLLVPWLGSQTTFVGLCLVHLSVGLGFATRAARRPVRALAFAVPLVAALGVAAFVPSDLMWRSAHRQHGELIFSKENELEVLAVTDSSQGVRALWGGPFVSGSSTRRLVQTLQGHLAMLLHPKPERVLEIGYGVGEILRSITRHHPRRLDLVEIDPDMVTTANQHFELLNERASERPEVNVQVMDGRLYLAMTREKYDVIMSDTFFVVSESSMRLYTLEHYQNASAHLADGGMMVAWIPFNMPESQSRIILTTFSAAFPHVLAWRYRSELFVFGFNQPPKVSLEGFASRTQAPEVRADLERVGFADPLGLLTGFVACPEKFARLFPPKQELINRDLSPLLDFALTAPNLESELRRQLSRGGTQCVESILVWDGPESLVQGTREALRDEEQVGEEAAELTRQFDERFLGVGDGLGESELAATAARARALLARAPHQVVVRLIAASALGALGRMQLAREDDEAGERALREALSMHPFHFPSNYALWHHYAEQGRDDVASPYREAALRARPYVLAPTRETALALSH